MVVKNQLVFLLITFFIIVICEGKFNTKDGLKEVCLGAERFVIAYNKNCVQKKGAQEKIPDSTVVALCLAELSKQNSKPNSGGKRFGSADDISESNQRKAIALRHGPRSSVIDVSVDELPIDHIEQVLKTIRRAVTFFSTLNQVKLNTILLATRTVQAQIALTLEYTKLHMEPSLVAKLLELQDYCKNISMELEQTNAQKWNWVDRMTSTTYFWKMPAANSWKDWSILEATEIRPVTEFKNLTNYHTEHEANNECYLQMIKDCGLSQECADILMDSSAVLTTLAHNVRFFQIAIKMDCVNEVNFANKFRESNWQSVLGTYCTKMWNEANIIANADFPVGYKGLFLTQSTMCAFVGYPNFLRADWMSHIMSWMDSTVNGCIAPDTKTGTGDLSGEYDVIANDGEWCSLWETSMAVQILITHLRYLVENSVAGN